MTGGDDDVVAVAGRVDVAPTPPSAGVVVVGVPSGSSTSISLFVLKSFPSNTSGVVYRHVVRSSELTPMGSSNATTPILLPFASATTSSWLFPALTRYRNETVCRPASHPPSSSTAYAEEAPPSDGPASPAFDSCMSAKYTNPSPWNPLAHGTSTDSARSSSAESCVA